MTTSGVHRIRAGYVSAYIIDGDEGVTLIDTLLPKKEGAIARALGEIGRSLEDVTAILLTHSHADHAGSAAVVKTASNATVYAGASDAPAIRGDHKPPPPPLMAPVPLRWISNAMPVPPPTAVDHQISEAGSPRLPEDLRAIDTPGHTPGHTSYLLDRDGGVLFVGDAARATKAGKVVRGFFNRSTPTVDTSIRHLAEFEFEMAVFGHAAPLRTGASGAFRRFAAGLETRG